MLLPRSEEVSFREEGRGCLCRLEEQYFEFMEVLQEDAQSIVRSGVVVFWDVPIRETFAQ